MFDWNKDGKQDWKDDYLFNELIKPKHDPATQNKRVASGSPLIGCFIFAVIYLFFLICK